ncbi:hypothetical protein HBI81_009810 [Parastagonospora nodorum]|nr:hypothetical protein HBI81_009810 [Parastagonospora nodorum]
MVIQTVGIVGTGVIGASWTGLFLAHGLRVLVADPAPGAKEKLEKHLKAIWPTLQSIGTKKSASLANYTFVGASLGQHYKKVDFVQENAPERPRTPGFKAVPLGRNRLLRSLRRRHRILILRHTQLPIHQQMQNSRTSSDRASIQPPQPVETYT